MRLKTTMVVLSDHRIKQVKTISISQIGGHLFVNFALGRYLCKKDPVPYKINARVNILQ